MPLTSGSTRPPSRPEGGRGVFSARTALLAAAIGLLLASTAVVHAPALDARAMCFDDAEYIAHNRLVSHPSWASVGRFFAEVERPSTFTGYYHPLAMTVLMLGHAAGGRAESPRAFHAISLALHLANVLLVVLIVYSLFGRLGAAIATGALFAWHPLTIEPVVWIAEQKTLLAAGFSLGATLSYIAWTRSHRRGRLATAWGFYILALLSKPSALPLPACFLALDAWPLRRLDRRAALEKWPFLLPMLASAAITLTSQQHVGGITPGDSSEFATWPWRALAALGTAFLHLIWPHPLSPVYPVPARLGPTQPVVLGGIVWMVMLSVAAAALWKRWRGPMIALVIFVVGLAPTLTPIRYTWAMTFDSYAYLPMLGILLFAGSCLAAIPRRAVAASATTLLVTATILGLEAHEARSALRPWRNTLSLFAHMERVAPESPVVLNQYGVELARQGRPDAAIRRLRRAVAIAPGYGAAQYNLGAALLGAGDAAGSMAALRRAVERLPKDAEASFTLGQSLLFGGNPAAAESALRRTMAIDPDHAPAAALLAGVLSGRDTREALSWMRKAVAADPTNERFEYQLAAMLSVSSAPDESVATHLARASALAPRWAPPLNDLAWLSSARPGSRLYDPPRAVELARRAIASSAGNDPRLLDTYSVALAASGRFPEAESVETRAVSLLEGRPDLSRDLRSRRALYARSQPYSEPVSPAHGTNEHLRD